MRVHRPTENARSVHARDVIDHRVLLAGRGRRSTVNTFGQSRMFQLSLKYFDQIDQTYRPTAFSAIFFFY